MKKIIIAASFAIALSSGSVSADTVYCVNCGTELTQYLNYAQLFEQTNTTIQQLEVMRQQAARLTSTTPFSQTAALLTGIMSTVNQGQALGYSISNITKKFQSQYPEFGKQQGNYFENYKAWSATTSDSIKAALLASGLQMDNFATESATAETLRVMNQSATGQMQAIQVGNAVSSEMLDEMRKLRQLNTAQSQAQNAFLMGERQQQDNSQANLKTLLNPKNSVLKSYDEYFKDYK